MKGETVFNSRRLISPKSIRADVQVTEVVPQRRMAEIMVRDLKDGDSGFALANTPRALTFTDYVATKYPVHRSKGTTSPEYDVGAQRRRGVLSLAAWAQALGVVQVTLLE